MMQPKKFILRTLKKVIIFACIMIVAMSVVQSPTITNEVALGQMRNSDTAYVLMDIYQKIRPVFNIICAGITVLFTCNIACDTYKFIKNIKNENEKEKK